jgi:hypothetical protein
VKQFRTVRHAILEDGSVLLRFVDAKPLYRRDLRRTPWAPVPPQPEPDRDIGVLGVSFQREDPDDPESTPTGVSGVSLWLEGGTAPSDLSRFAWARWLAVAEAIARTGGDIGHPSWRSDDLADPSTVVGQMTRATYAEYGVALRTTKPGRKGHPASFYEEIAARYRELLAEGYTDPTRRISEERQYSRNTVAGWIRKARQLGYLAPARKGKAG